MPPRTKLTPAIQKRMVQALRIGSTYKLACLYAGISNDSWERWRKLGAAGRAPYAAFAEACEKAEAAAVVHWLAQIEQAAQGGQWQASAWRLERRYPQDYGRLLHEHSGRDGGPIEMAVVRLPSKAPSLDIWTTEQDVTPYDTNGHTLSAPIALPPLEDDDPCL